MPEPQPTPDQYIEPPPAGWGGMGGPVGTPSDAFGLQPQMRPPAAPKPQPAPTGPPDEVIQPQGGTQLPVRQVSATGEAGGAPPMRDQIRQMWIDAGATPEAADGILRRVQVESGFNPLAMGDYRDGKPTSFGLYQHHDDRAKALYAFATKQGKSPSDPLVQTAFAIQEAAKGGDPTATANWDKIKSDPTGSAFTQYFERPAGVGLKQWATTESPELKARGDAIMAEADQMRDKHIAAITQLMADANAAPAGSKARDDAIAEVRDRERRYSLEYERIAMHPPPMKPVDAMANFGSAGTIIALIGGLFARNHMTAALGAAGKAMQAINQNNFDEYQREYKVWDQQSKTALDMVKIQHDELRELIDDKKMAFDEKNTKLHTALEAMGMISQAKEMALGAHEKVYTEVAGLERAHMSAAQSKLAYQTAVAGQLEAKYITDGMSPEEAKTRAYREAGLVPLMATDKAKPSNIEALGKDGKPIYSGMATFNPVTKEYTPVGWDHPLPAEAQIKPGVTAAAGRQAATQTQALAGATAEMTKDLSNLMKIPIDANLGPFMGLQSEHPDSLSDALRRVVATHVTPDKAIALGQMFGGLKRQLGIIEGQGRATGVVGLTESNQVLVPQSGWTGLDVLRSYAQMAQIGEQNARVMLHSPQVADEQKTMMTELVKELRAAVPFTVDDVNAVAFGDKNSVREFADKMIKNREMAKGEGSGAPPAPGAVQDGYRFKGGNPADQQNWEKVQ